MSDLPPRMKSQRLVNKAIKQKELELKNTHLLKNQLILNPTFNDLLPGLNELTDSLQAFPFELIRYFTLLKEIDAKCINTIPYLRFYIIRFIQMKKTHPKRDLLLLKIRNLIKELMPCLEEKMHVATIASDTVNKNINRINQCYDIIINNNEIPKIIRIGDLNHPAFTTNNDTLANENKSAQSQRSESRREALAAKKAIASTNGNLMDMDDSRSNTPAPFGIDNNMVANGSNNGSNKSLLNATNAVLTTTKKTKSKETKKRKQPAHSNNANGTSNSNSNSHSNGSGNSNNGNSNNNNNNAAGSNGYINQSQYDGTVEEPPKKKQKPRKERVKKEESVAVSASNSSNTTNGTKANNSNSRAVAAAAVHEVEEADNTKEEPVYCYCQQVSYGEMVGCDGEHCEKEWFHLPCTGLKELPTGEWFCDDCISRIAHSRKKR